MASPENYNQLLSKLGKWTFFTTLIFLIALRYLDLVPKIEVDSSLIPPLNDYHELIEWCLSFGVVPLFGAGISWLFSSIFEVHNKLSKLILLRYLWEKLFIVAPMLERAGVNKRLNQRLVNEVMVGLYYPEVKNIDQHYVHIFWRYSLQFWVIFEHFWVVLVTIVALGVFDGAIPDKRLFIYLGAVFVVGAVHWLFVVTKKSRDQADQIPGSAIRLFFKS